MLDGAAIVYVDRVKRYRRNRSPGEEDGEAGSRLPAYSTAAGKLLLAHLPEREQQELLSAMTMTKRGPHTITSKKALREELAEIPVASMVVNDETG